MDLSAEKPETFELYGPDAKKPGTFAANCLLARRLAERGVKFIQLYHQGWDQHGGLPKNIQVQCQETDQACAALITDLKQRGMLDDTLVIWGGEFGRTSYSQGKLTADNYGRDHHPRCFSMWMAGGGVKGGLVHGETDDFSYNVAKDGVHVYDFQATLMHLLGVDHERLNYMFQGRPANPSPRAQMFLESPRLGFGRKSFQLEQARAVDDGNSFAKRVARKVDRPGRCRT